jgi:AI-2 transport protein TqsA
MPSSSLPPLHRTVLLGAGLVVIAAGLHASGGTVNLILVSALLAMTLSPIPFLLEGRGVKHGPAVALTVLGALVGGALLVTALAAGLSGLQAKLPAYQESLSGLLGGLERVLSARGAPEVEAGSLTGHFAVVGVSVRRFVALTGLMGAGQAVANLLVMLAVGTDFPLVWAVLFFLLNFVPFGFILGMIPPLVVTLLEHGPARAGILLGVTFAINAVSDNVVKPKVMGQSLGLSPLVIVLSLMAWSLILGPIGAILAVPLTIALTLTVPHLSGSARPAE